MKDSSHLGIVMMVITMMIFAGQDAVSRILAERYNVMMIVMLRYWFMALFVLALAIIWQGGVARVAKSNRIWVQIGRGVLLVLEIVVAVTGFVLLGLVESHVIFGFYPLIVTALSVPVLGEQVGWRRWVAVVIGFIGVLVILRPGFAVFSPFALIPLLAAFMFAFYSLMTRLVSKTDRTETSLFWMAIAGCVTITFGVPFFWEPLVGVDWLWMVLLCILSISGHFFLIKALTLAEAVTVQPFAYLHLVFASTLGVLIFGDALGIWTVIGGTIVVASGVFALLRARQVAR